MRLELTQELANEISQFHGLKHEKTESEARRSRIQSINSRPDYSTPKGIASGDLYSGNNALD